MTAYRASPHITRFIADNWCWDHSFRLYDAYFCPHLWWITDLKGLEVAELTFGQGLARIVLLAYYNSPNAITVENLIHHLRQLAIFYQTHDVEEWANKIKHDINQIHEIITELCKHNLLLPCELI